MYEIHKNLEFRGHSMTSWNSQGLVKSLVLLVLIWCSEKVLLEIRKKKKLWVRTSQSCWDTQLACPSRKGLRNKYYTWSSSDHPASSFQQTERTESQRTLNGLSTSSRWWRWLKMTKREWKIPTMLNCCSISDQTTTKKIVDLLGKKNFV